jgi:hypothetical protein
MTDNAAANSSGHDASDRLLELATDFADNLTTRIGRIVPLEAKFSALATGTATTGRVMVGVLEEGIKPESIPLTIGGDSKLRLLIKFNCGWDSSADFLAVDASWFHVRLGDREKDEPLFRYEYLRHPGNDVPCAHLQVHGHRDEFLFMLVAGDRARPAQRQRSGSVPRLCEFHFPLGGHRFRPCIEDVLQALVLEFGVDTVDGWRTAVLEGRESWRRTQLKSAVRDAPADAAEVLGALGWDVTPPVSPPKANAERLRAF